MDKGTELKPDVLYWTKNGRGEVIKFNEGLDLATRDRAILKPRKTHTVDVWDAGICRNISAIAETEEDAKNIIY